MADLQFCYNRTDQHNPLRRGDLRTTCKPRLSTMCNPIRPRELTHRVIEKPIEKREMQASLAQMCSFKTRKPSNSVARFE
ncbi:MAG TPA: hypothetical protein DDW52_04080 [Planctomycetaceae bacterium]|nr:hypothetical protein [Planctomycetaceae bacterium]